MQEPNTEILEYDPEPERTLRKRLRVVRLARTAMGDEGQPPRRTMGDYCKRFDVEQISLGFRPANPVNFDIK
ncbi:hypothetical protein A2U01_0070294, partial [Trifolium medium]|nr:hypothetical protein [Trifolium medium]